MLMLVCLFMIFAVFVNSVYKTAVFTFIFAVLLPVLSRPLIMSINILHFSIFQDGGRLLVWRTYPKMSVIRKFCNFVRAIHYQFVKIVLRTCSPRCDHRGLHVRNTIFTN